MAVLSAPLLGLIEEVVNKWTGERRMFTAYVVSKEVQRLGKERNIETMRHAHMGQAVHLALSGALGSGEYERSLQDVGAPEMAFVFHPRGTDSSHYPPIDLSKPPIESAPVADTLTAPVAATPAAPAAPAAPAPAATSSDNTASLAKDRLNVPTFLSKAAGFNAGDTVYVTDKDPTGVIQPPCLLLLKESPPEPLTDYRVAADGRIRITPATLKIAGLDGTDFEFEGDAGRIVVKPK